MEERKTIFNYLGQVLMLFGVIAVMLNIFCVLFGESAQEYSTMFSLGKSGLSVETMAEFFLLAPVIVFLRFIFFTDVVIKNLSILARTVSMVLLVLAAVAVFIVLFGWFPAEMWQPWLMFFLCFGVCFVISAMLSAWKERLENKRMEEALRKLKQQDAGGGEMLH